MKPISFLMRGIAVVSGCGVIIGMLCLWLQCDRYPKRQSIEIMRARTFQELMETVACSHTTIRRSNHYPPTEARKFSGWLLQWNPESVRAGDFHVDRETGCILDVWATPIVLVVDEDSLVGVGSAGQNRAWEQGGNDDIVVYFRDLDVPTGPAGSPWRAAEDEKPGTSTSRPLLRSRGP